MEKITAGDIVRSSEFRALGMDDRGILRLADKGLMRKVEDPRGGLFGWCKPDWFPEDELTQDTLRAVSIARRHPDAVICLGGALRLHELSDDFNAPWSAAVAKGKNRSTKLDGVNLIVWGNPIEFEVGVMTKTLLGYDVKMTDPVRTVLDCITARRSDFSPSVETWQSALQDLISSQDVNEITRTLASYAVKLKLDDAVMPLIWATAAGGNAKKP
jgi:predicted transcriptional regulator of viral defense system